MSSSCRARLSSGHLLPLLVIIGYGALSLLTCYLSQRFTVSLTTCVLKRTTGIPCPFCGGTRAAWALLHGDLHTAVMMNPLAAALCLLGPPGYIIYRLLLQGRSSRVPRLVWIALIALTLVNWAYLIHVGR